MAALDKSKIEKRMESARDVANGTMEMWVVLETQEEVKIAKAWMKGKRKAKNLEPLTVEESDKRKAKRRKEIARSMGIKE